MKKELVTSLRKTVATAGILFLCPGDDIALSAGILATSATINTHQSEVPHAALLPNTEIRIANPAQEIKNRRKVGKNGRFHTPPYTPEPRAIEPTIKIAWPKRGVS